MNGRCCERSTCHSLQFQPISMRPLATVYGRAETQAFLLRLSLFHRSPPVWSTVYGRVQDNCVTAAHRQITRLERTQSVATYINGVCYRGPHYQLGNNAEYADDETLKVRCLNAFTSFFLKPSKRSHAQQPKRFLPGCCENDFIIFP